MLEHELAKLELTASSADQALKDTASWTKNHCNDMKKVLDDIESLEVVLREKNPPIDIRPQLNKIKASYTVLEDAWMQRFNLRNSSLKKSVEASNEQVKKLGLQILEFKAKSDSVDLEIENITNDVVDRKINLALLKYQQEQYAKDLKGLDKEFGQALVDLEEYVNSATKVGQRIVPMKTTMDLLEELRVTDGYLAALADASEDIERMYESYSKLYLELKEKARLVAENREKAMEEVNMRSDAWRNLIHKLLDQVNVKYKKILCEAYAVGKVKLTNEQDIEDAGLEIFVGFKGGKPVPLNAYTQSGGERSTATVTFLLALQQHVHSPFRAVDEYDVHMDPKNREIIANLLVSSVTGLDSQYLAITPSQLTFTGKDIHLITVQNVEGASLIKEVT